MKVALLHHHSYETLKNASRILKEAKSLKTHGHDVVIITYDFFGEKTIHAYGEEIRVVGFPPRWRKAFKFLRRKGKTTKEKMPCLAAWWIIKERPDVIHAHDYDTLLTGVVTGKLLGIPVIYDAHEYLMERWDQAGAPEKQRKLTKRNERFLVRQCHTSIAVNDSIARLMAENLSQPMPLTLHNFPFYTEIEENNGLHEELKIPTETKIVLYVGGFSKTKGLSVLFKVSKLLPDVTFVLMGHGPLQDEFKDTIQQNRINNVILKPSVAPDEIIAWTSSADVGVHPVPNMSLNHFNSLGNKIGEYIMAGLPIAVSDFPEMHKLAVDEDMGVVFDQESPEDIARALGELLDPETYARKKKNVMEKRHKYCWENEEAKLIKLYNEITN